MSKTISRNELSARLQTATPPVLVEALSARHYLDRHLPGAINIPHEEIEQQAATKLPDRQAEIVVYCANTECRNSTIAAEALERLGYANVFEYVEGKEDWAEAGLPFESGEEPARSAA